MNRLANTPPDGAEAKASDIRSVRRVSWRRLWLKIHLHLGLSVGAVFVLIGLTGSVVAFRPELDEWLTPQLMQVEPNKDRRTAYRSLGEIVASGTGIRPILDASCPADRAG